MFLTLVFAENSVLSEEISLKNAHGTYIVSARVNEILTLDFILDTGASSVTIPRNTFSVLL
jgi:predicted aspartyl protease